MSIPFGQQSSLGSAMVSNTKKGLWISGKMAVSKNFGMDNWALWMTTSIQWEGRPNSPIHSGLKSNCHKKVILLSKSKIWRMPGENWNWSMQKAANFCESRLHADRCQPRFRGGTACPWRPSAIGGLCLSMAASSSQPSHYWSIVCRGCCTRINCRKQNHWSPSGL